MTNSFQLLNKAIQNTFKKYNVHNEVVQRSLITDCCNNDLAVIADDYRMFNWFVDCNHAQYNGNYRLLQLANAMQGKPFVWLNDVSVMIKTKQYQAAAIENRDSILHVVGDGFNMALNWRCDVLNYLIHRVKKEVSNG